MGEISQVNHVINDINRNQSEINSKQTSTISHELDSNQTLLTDELDTNIKKEIESKHLDIEPINEENLDDEQVVMIDKLNINMEKLDEMLFNPLQFGTNLQKNRDIFDPISSETIDSNDQVVINHDQDFNAEHDFIITENKSSSVINQPESLFNQAYLILQNRNEILFKSDKKSYRESLQRDEILKMHDGESSIMKFENDDLTEPFFSNSQSINEQECLKIQEYEQKIPIKSNERMVIVSDTDESLDNLIDPVPTSNLDSTDL
jgi:hypothetical protein